jgi:hypothetical protein
MGWSGRAPAPPASKAGEGGCEDKEHAMSEKLNSEIAVIGIDIGKNSFHLVGQDRRGRIISWPHRRRHCTVNSASVTSSS